MQRSTQIALGSAAMYISGQRLEGGMSTMAGIASRGVISAFIMLAVAGCHGWGSMDRELGRKISERAGRVLEVGPGSVVEISLLPRSEYDRRAWSDCHTRRVWFDLKDSKGASQERLYKEILPVFDGGDKPSREIDALSFDLIIQNQEKEGWSVGKKSEPYSSYKIKGAGFYTLELRVDCYHSSLRLLYSGKSEPVRMRIFKRSLGPPKGQSAEPLKMAVGGKGTSNGGAPAF